VNTKRNKKIRRPVRLDRRAFATPKRPWLRPRRRDGLAKILDLELIQEGLKVSLLLASVRRKAPRWEEFGKRRYGRPSSGAAR
jgi:hypothetical protein